MKKLPVFIAICAALTFGFSQEVSALPGDIGFFGGISEGRRLPKTIETVVTGNARVSGNANQTREFLYKEIVFLTGKPVEFTGILEVSGANGVVPNSRSGNFTQMLRVYPSAASGTDAIINRDVVYSVNYRKEGRQLIKDYTVRDWNETINVDGVTFTLDRAQSGFDISIIEHETPGVVYYRGDLSSCSVYTTNGNTDTLRLDAADSFHGYACAWSGAEVHRLEAALTGNDWQMLYQVRPSVSANKTLWYTENEPEAISFEGNYKDVLKNQSGLKYVILQAPHIYPDLPKEGGASIPTRNTFEQLIFPDLDFLKGHPAMEDIHKLFSMQILDGDPRFFLPEQSISRSQYVSALVKAIKLPVETAVPGPRGRRRNQAPPIVFPDVQPARPDYPYIMAAYRSGLAIGRDHGTFYADSQLERQEAFTIAVRALGVVNLGRAEHTGFFTDDDQIAQWARQSLAAAYRLKLIKPDMDGRIRPGDFVSKAEAAALLRELVDYMRIGIASDYAEHLVNYAR